MTPHAEGVKFYISQNYLRYKLMGQMRLFKSHFYIERFTNSNQMSVVMKL